MWPIIANAEALAVSQSYFGHPGTLSDEDKDNSGEAWQIWSKPQAAGAVAVLLVSRALTTGRNVPPIDLSLTLSNYVAGVATVRDLWNHKDLGQHTGTLHFPAVVSHDSVFLLLSPTNNGDEQ
jgi:hypothetical protein